MKPKRLVVGDSGDEVASVHEKLELHGVEVSPDERKRHFFGPSTRAAVREFQKVHGIDPSCEVCEETATALASQPSSPIATSSSARMTLNLSAIPTAGDSSSDIRVVAATPTARATPMTNLGTSSAVASAGNNQAHVEGCIFLEHGSPANGITLRIYNRGFGSTETKLGEIKTDEKGSYALTYDTGGKTANLEVRAVDAQGKEIPLSTTKFGAAGQEVIDLVAPSKLQPPDTEFSRLNSALAAQIDKPENIKRAVERGRQRDITTLVAGTGWDGRALALASTAYEHAERTKMPADSLYALYRSGFPTEPQVLARVSAHSVEMGLRRAAEVGIIDSAGIEAASTAFRDFAAEERLKFRPRGMLGSVSEFVSGARVSDQDREAFKAVLKDGLGTDLWQRAKATVSPEGIASLQLQGKLAYLTLNNVELTGWLQPMLTSGDPRQLIDLGYDNPEKWKTEFTSHIQGDPDRLGYLIPSAFEGADLEQRLEAYSDELARRVRQMDPSRVTIQRLARGELEGIPAAILPNVKTFLSTAAAKGFKLGQTPFSSFVAEEGETALLPDLEDDKKKAALEEVKALHRLFSVAPSDKALEVLLKAGFKSAHDIVEIPYADFVARFGPEIGSTHETQHLYWKAQQQSATIINVFTGAKRLENKVSTNGTSASGQQADKRLREVKEKLKGRFPTLETLFGNVDYCDCEDCRSVLSPAAYLVDILHFLDPRGPQWDVQKALWKERNGDEEYSLKYKKPYEALIARRPDLPHIALTCENTNTTFPYIDNINEILELLVSKGTPGTEAFDTGSASSQDLIAEPQNITWEAYTGGNGKKGLIDFVYPNNLPFDLPLEMIRAMLNQFDVPLWKLRELIAHPSTLDGLRNVWFERIGLGPADLKVIAGEYPWYELYGFTNETDALDGLVDSTTQQRDPTTSLRNAKTLSRRLSVTYKELVELVKTGFVNPELEKLIVLHKLEVDAHDVARYFAVDESEQLSPAEKSAFEARLLLLKDQYPSFDPNSLSTLWNDAVQEKVLLLRSPEVGCDFSETTLGFSKLPKNDEEAMALVFLKLNVFIRLQRKLGWSTQMLDHALSVFIRPSIDGLMMSTWGPTLRTAVTYLAHLVEISELIRERVNDEELLTLWAPIRSTGESSLYERLFLTRSILSRDAVFDHPLGRYLQSSPELVANHTDAVAQALQLSHEEIAQIFKQTGVQNATLSVPNLSLLMRHKVLARALNLSVPQLLALLKLTTKQPFQELASAPIQDVASDVPLSQTLAFIHEVDLMSAAGLDAETLDTICRHQGPSIDDRTRDQLIESIFLALTALPKIASQSASTPSEDASGSESRQRLAVIQTLAAQLSSPEPLVAKLVTSVLKESGNNTPFLTSIQAAQESALPGKATKWEAHVWFAAGGTYLLTATQASGTLSFGIENEIESVENVGGQSKGSIFKLADIRVGQRYQLKLELPTEGEVSIQGDNLPKSTLASLTAVSSDTYAKFARTLAILKKVLDLLRILDLGEAELDLLRSLPNTLDLTTLPVVPIQDGKGIYERLLPWLDISSAVKHFMVGDGVADVLKAARRSYGKPNQQTVFEASLAEAVAAMLGHRLEFVQAAIKALQIETKVVSSSVPFVYEVSEFRTGVGLRWVADAIAVLVRLGLNPDDVVDWATKPIDATLATQVRGALKGRYAPDAWRRVARPIFDVLRKKQRDALGSHLTNLPNAPYGETAEQLYEYLLLDPGMEPPVLTSRIQLAISSVQLFVQRCLMNLEADVTPDIIDAKRWEWMFRYRVWEANRKLFLWPENWLEPEFRDDKSHLFRELESALLQGDVSDDLVRTALYTYLKGLETIARLELMTMYFEPGISADGSTIHLIARTQTAPHKYFYRKCSHGMWTPWEPLNVDIEGEHLALTMWRGRLHLFWITFLDKAEAKDPPKQADGKESTFAQLSDKTPGDLKAEKAIQLQLNWVEQLQGNWASRSSTNFEDAPSFKNLGATSSDEKRKFFIHVKVDTRNTPELGDDVLEVHIAYYDNSNANWKAYERYQLISKLTPPVLEHQGSAPLGSGPIQVNTPRATKWEGANSLRVKFKQQEKETGGAKDISEGTFDILKQGTNYKLLFPTNEIRLALGEATPPAAAGKPSGYIFWPQGAQHIVYRGVDGAIHDVWWTKNGWYHTDASGAADAEPATGDPHGYPLDELHMHCVAYYAGPKLLELSWSQADSLGPDADQDLATAWRADVLFEAMQGAPSPVGRPLGGLFTPNRGVVYRLANNQLFAVVQEKAQGPFMRVLLNSGNLPQAASDPTGFVMSETSLDVTSISSRHIFFRGIDNHIHELKSDIAGTQWQHHDLTAMTGAPSAKGNPVAYPFLGKKTKHVVYCSEDGTIHQLWGNATGWYHNAIGKDLPKSKGDPTGYVFEHQGTQHIVYRGEDDHIHEIGLVSGGLNHATHKPVWVWRHEVLTTEVGQAPRAAGDPAGYAFEQIGTHHVVYRAKDERPDTEGKWLSELWWKDIWHVNNYELARPDLDDVGPLISPFFYEDLTNPYTFFVEPSLAERTVHDWEEYVLSTEEYVEVQIPQTVIPVPYYPERTVSFKPTDVGLFDQKFRVKDFLFDDDHVLLLKNRIFGPQGGISANEITAVKWQGGGNGGQQMRIVNTTHGLSSESEFGLSPAMFSSFSGGF